MNTCPYCTLDFADSFSFFEHVFTHNIEWVPELKEIREERFNFYDALNVREERFSSMMVSMGSVDRNFEAT